MGERHAGSVEVTGSSPVGSTSVQGFVGSLKWREKTFETAKKRPKRALRGSFFAYYKPQIVVSALVVALLAGGAYYSSHVSESSPKVVYSTSFDEAKAEAQTPLLVNINTADAKELDELPEVGPSTAEKIIEYRRRNGSFKPVDKLSSVRN